MATVPLIRYEDAPRDVKEIFDDIKRTRNIEEVNNFWQALANQPETLKRTWELVREVMRPGALDEMTKEMIYAAVSITNNCEYCIHSHTAAAFNKGMSEPQVPGIARSHCYGASHQRARERLQDSGGRAVQASLIGIAPTRDVKPLKGCVPCSPQSPNTGSPGTSRSWTGVRLSEKSTYPAGVRRGYMTVEGLDYQVYREGLMSGDFILASNKTVLARAKKPNAFRRSFTIEHGDKKYTLGAKSAFRRGFILLDGNREVGSLSPQGVFTRQASADLPQHLPLSLKVFIIWLGIIMWKRESDSAAPSAGGD